MARSIHLEAGLITGGSKSRSNYSVGYSNSASWEATVSALNDPGMSTAKQKQYLPQLFDTYRKADGYGAP